MKSGSTFISERNIALFLDVDGTLLDIASTPDAVQVPMSLSNTLQLAKEHEHGALALISGRSISDLDHLFAPHIFPVAGLHGFERRGVQGTTIRPFVDPNLLDPARTALSILQQQHKGLLVEDKGVALAMHYRLATHLELLVYKTMTELIAALNGQFVLRAGKCVFELLPSGYSKLNAIEEFMMEAPFAGRVPVFIGDDITDEDGFAAVNALGGYSIRVGAGESIARSRLENVPAVIAWLHERSLEFRPSSEPSSESFSESLSESTSQSFKQ